MPESLDIHQLRVFQAAARNHSFTRASEQPRLSQSTVSQHIRRLEDSLGCLLFLRVGKRVVLSQAGEVLLEYAERIFSDVTNAELAVRELNSLKRGKVRLGICATALSCRVPQILAG